MSKCYSVLFLLGVMCLPGFFALSVGGRTEQPMTMAQEITELRKLRDRGTISYEEFETGKLTLLQGYRPDEPSLVNPAETQLADYPAPIETAQK